MYNKINLFYAYNSMSCDKYIHLCNYHHHQEHFYCPKKLPCTFFVFSPVPLSPSNH